MFVSGLDSYWRRMCEATTCMSLWKQKFVPERIMHTFKSYASRSLNHMGIDAPDRKRWARHGSSRWLWKDEDVQEAIKYVVSEQGEPKEVYVNEEV